MSRLLVTYLCLCVCIITLTPLTSTEVEASQSIQHDDIDSHSHFIALQAHDHDHDHGAHDNVTMSSSSTGVNGTVATNGTSTNNNGTAGADDDHDHDHADAGAGSSVHSHSSDETKLRTGKAVLIPLIFFATLLASYLPWGLKRFHNAMNWMAVSACFTAGIILGAALSHLIIEAGLAFEEYEEMKNPPAPGADAHGHGGGGEEEEGGHSHPYPYASLIAGAVLLTLIAIDFKMVRHGLLGDSHGHGHGHGDGGHSHLIANLTEAQLNGQRKPDEEKPKQQQTTQQLVPDDDEHAVTIHTGDDISTVPTTKNDIPMDTISSSSDTIVTPEKEKETSTSTSSDGIAGPESSEIMNRGSKAQIARAWIFFAALSIHSIFDGLSVGAESSMSGFYSLLAAVGGHKLLDGFALGVPIYFANFSPIHTAIAIIFCASMTPLGIGIGMAATTGVGSQSATLAEAIILSMSAGSFLFISLIELVPAGFASTTWINLKLAALFLGWGIMTMLAKWV